MSVDDYLSRDEVREFAQRSDAAGWRMLLGNWLLIAAVFLAAALWTHPLALIVAVLLLGGRQLGLAVLMHEAGHKTLFANPRLNHFCGQWLAAYPILGDCDAYAASHREHHRHAGTVHDPDLANYRNYPVSVASFRRKLWRDISGQTGARMLLGQLRGAGNRLILRQGERSNALRYGLLANLLLLLVLTLSGQPELYLLWVAAYLTSYPMVARIRQVAEHGAVTDLYQTDPRLNTRTTLPRWYERLLLCPNYVNYHLEHHLLAGVPAHRLPALHQLLKARGFYAKHPQCLARGYRAVLGSAVPALKA